MTDRVENERAVIGGNNPPEPTREERFSTILDDVEKLAARATKSPHPITSNADLDVVVEVVKASKRFIEKIDEVRKDANRPLTDEVKANNDWFRPHSERLDRVVSVLNQRAFDYATAEREKEQARLREEARQREDAARAERERQEAERAAGIEKTGIDAEIEQERLDRLEGQHIAAERAVMRDVGPARVSAGTVGTRTTIEGRIVDRNAMDLNELKASFTLDMLEKAIRDHIKRNKKTVPLKGVEFYDKHSTNIR